MPHRTRIFHNGSNKTAENRTKLTVLELQAFFSVVADNFFTAVYFNFNWLFYCKKVTFCNQVTDCFIFCRKYFRFN